MRRTVFNEDHEAFRETLRAFIEAEVVPVYDEWFAAGQAPRDFYYKLAELGVFGIRVDEEFGGAGIDSYKFEAVMYEETARAGVSFGGSGVHVLLGLPYIKALATDEQKKRFLPKFVSGEEMWALAMTEPGTGSDLAGMKTTAKLSEDGSHYVLNGSKTFITGGVHADRVIVCARTDAPSAEDRRHGISLFAVDTKAEGYSIGRKLDKLGLKTSDTAELAFVDVKVPVEDLLGEENKGFYYLGGNLPSERWGIAFGAYAQAAAAVRFAKEYVLERTVFGKPVSHFQNTKFELAACQAEVDAAQAVADRSLEALDAGELSAGRGRVREALLHRGRAPRHRPLPPAARRLRLHERVPDRPAVRGQPRQPHLRRDQRDHEVDHRQGHGSVRSAKLPHGTTEA